MPKLPKCPGSGRVVRAFANWEILSDSGRRFPARRQPCPECHNLVRTWAQEGMSNWRYSEHVRRPAPVGDLSAWTRAAGDWLQAREAVS